MVYKVSDVAELIGVEKTEIFEKMITHKALLDPNISKVDGVTYFDDRGFEILKTLFSKVNDETVIEKSEIKPIKSVSKFEKERDILYDKVDILKNELFNLDSELELKDEMILKYQDKLIEDIEHINRLQYMLMKKYEKAVE
ncbi:hypothetical protein QE109_13585 [Fusibacter bizertensis]|uniref:MerR family transcriptional regulator n=1 Tax=Fusibacter bizertensis TaxID=1488331 RepID=A0ABT6NFJ7_9FIRM|nr:hypothetical protein [Fusibacter bizertensis]